MEKSQDEIVKEKVAKQMNSYKKAMEKFYQNPNIIYNNIGKICCDIIQQGKPLTFDLLLAECRQRLDKIDNKTEENPLDFEADKLRNVLAHLESLGTHTHK